jgi:hypothetical protein
MNERAKTFEESRRIIQICRDAVTVLQYTYTTLINAQKMCVHVMKECGAYEI